MRRYIYFYIYFQNSLNCVFMMSIRYSVLGNLSWVMLPKGIWLSYGKESDTFLFHLKFCKLLACLGCFFVNFWHICYLHGRQSHMPSFAMVRVKAGPCFGLAVVCIIYTNFSEIFRMKIIWILKQGGPGWDQIGLMGLSRAI